MRTEPFFTQVRIRREELDPDAYPLRIPAVAQMESIRFHPAVTYFVGENASGKSTLVEAIAEAAGFGVEGGRKSFRMEGPETRGPRLADAISLGRMAGKEEDGFFLRAESMYDLASYVREIGVAGSYGGDLHEVSHGESFLNVFRGKFGGARRCLFILDEVEAALSPQRQLEFLMLMHEFVQRDSMFIVSTHSPILMSYPHSRLYWLSDEGIEEREWTETEHYRVTHGYLNRPDIMRRYFE